MAGIQGSIGQSSNNFGGADPSQVANMASKQEVSRIAGNLAQLIREYSNDKSDILRITEVDRNAVKNKIDALAWHGRCLNLISSD